MADDNPEQTTAVGFRAFVPGKLLASSPASESTHILIRRYRLPAEQPGSFGPAMVEPHVVAIERGSAMYGERALGGPWQECRVKAGDLFVTGSREPYESRWRAHGAGGIEAVHLHVGFQPYAEAVRAVFARDPAEVELADRAGFRDPFLSAFMVHADLFANEPSARLLRQSLSYAVAVHLARHYATCSLAAAMPVRRLSALQMHRLNAFIRSHLSEQFTIEAMAAEAGMSPFHFCRAFKNTTGLSPHRFVVRERILRAQELIRAGQLNLTEVALEVGYASPSHFAKVFTQHVGITPRRYRG